MFPNMKRLSVAEAAPRVLADLVTVHAAMVGAMVLSAAYQAITGEVSESHRLAEEFQLYYLKFTWFLAPLFPAVFAAFGFYTHSRAYVGRFKQIVIAQGVGIACAIFIAANVFLFPSEHLARSLMLPFAVLAALGVVSTRFLKDLFERHFEVHSRTTLAPTAMGPPKVLVLGGAGFIGGELVHRLLARGLAVRVLDAMVYGAGALEDVIREPALELMVGDCRNIGSVVSAMRGVSAVVDLAAIVGDPACNQDQQAALEINYAATRMIIEIAKAQRVRRFIFASSCSVYGETEFEVDERGQTRPLSLYAQTKIQSEQALLAAASETFNPIILRFATIFGFGYRPRFDLVVNLLCARAHFDRTITIFNGEQWRPFLYVTDAAGAILTMLDAPIELVGGEIFNVGDRRLNVTLRQLAEKVNRGFPETRIDYIENSDRRNYRVSFEKLKARTGFTPIRDLDFGIGELKQAFADGRIVDYTESRYHNLQSLRVSPPPAESARDSRVMAAFGEFAIAGAGK
jgi:nucleoside-diphosphate-sugar epimerase